MGCVYWVIGPIRFEDTVGDVFDRGESVKEIERTQKRTRPKNGMGQKVILGIEKLVKTITNFTYDKGDVMHSLFSKAQKE